MNTQQPYTNKDKTVNPTIKTVKDCTIITERNPATGMYTVATMQKLLARQARLTIALARAERIKQ